MAAGAPAGGLAPPALKAESSRARVRDPSAQDDLVHVANQIVDRPKSAADILRKVTGAEADHAVSGDPALRRIDESLALRLTLFDDLNHEPLSVNVCSKPALEHRS